MQPPARQENLVGEAASWLGGQTASNQPNNDDNGVEQKALHHGECMLREKGYQDGKRATGVPSGIRQEL